MYIYSSKIFHTCQNQTSFLTKPIIVPINCTIPIVIIISTALYQYSRNNIHQNGMIYKSLINKLHINITVADIFDTILH